MFKHKKYSSVGHEPGADLGPLISPEAKQRVCDLVQSGIDQGAKPLLDGRDVKVPGYEKGNFVGPTILHYVKVSEVTLKNTCILLGQYITFTKTYIVHVQCIFLLTK